MIVVCREFNREESSRVVSTDVVVDECHWETFNSRGSVQRTHQHTHQWNVSGSSSYRQVQRGREGEREGGKEGGRERETLTELLLISVTVYR